MGELQEGQTAGGELQEGGSELLAHEFVRRATSYFNKFRKMCFNNSTVETYHTLSQRFTYRYRGHLFLNVLSHKLASAPDFNFEEKLDWF